LNSLNSELAKVEGAEVTFDWPGEYETKEIPVIAFQAWTKSKSKEQEEGGEGDQTIIFCFEMNGIKFCHLGELGHVLTSDMVKQIGDVDVLMIKVGEGSNLSAKKATEVIEAIEPRIVIPMGENVPAAALKDLGADKVETQDNFEINSKGDLPEDQMRFIVLNKA
ncbi:MBL fold metallo-hydrolase, partial [Candidatus Peregrinibacteria bacterium]|nr:MBL fold metallo-hydrolase [Candidatus Peregrinibacteria bacterium]